MIRINNHIVLNRVYKTTFKRKEKKKKNTLKNALKHHLFTIKTLELTVKKLTNFGLPHVSGDEEGQSEQKGIRKAHRKSHKNESSSLKLIEVRQKHRM